MATVNRTLTESGNQGYVDVTTGLFSIKFFKSIIAKQVQSFERYQAYFSLILVTVPPETIKNLRRDLRDVASFLRSNVRVIDEMGSSGEGQFCILLPHTMSSGASVVSNRLRSGLTEMLGGEPADGLQVETISAPEKLGEIKQLADLI